MNNQKIQYMEKPEWVSWEDVLTCLHEAHKVNKRKGFVMPGYDMTVEKIKKKLGNGKCFVALDNGKVIGVNSVRFIKSRKWYVWGKRVAYCGLDGILKEYQGTDVFPSLNAIRARCIEENGVEVIEFNTAEHNKAVIKYNLKNGAKIVRYSPTGKGMDYYSVVMAKWRHGCPYPDWFINVMYYLSKFVVKAIWKPGRKFRFQFN